MNNGGGLEMKSKTVYIIVSLIGFLTGFILVSIKLIASTNSIIR